MSKRITLWLIVNAVLPILVPAFFLAFMQWIKEGSFPFFLTLVQLIKEGFYVFSALTLIFSLYEDYYLIKRCISPILQTWVVLMVISTSYQFYIMRQDPSSDYMSKNLFQFIVIWTSTVITAILIKYKLLKHKHNYLL